MRLIRIKRKVVAIDLKRSRPLFRIGDQVKVITGDMKNHIGRVLNINYYKGLVQVDGYKISKKYTKKQTIKRNGKKAIGVCNDLTRYIHISNVKAIVSK